MVDARAAVSSPAEISQHVRSSQHAHPWLEGQLIVILALTLDSLKRIGVADEGLPYKSVEYSFFDVAQLIHEELRLLPRVKAQYFHALLRFVACKIK